MIQYLYIAAGFSARGGFNKKQYPPAARAVEKGTKRFMKWVYKLERKFGRICIPHLMLVIIAGQAMVIWPICSTQTSCCSAVFR